ncbi:AKAP7 2'5' RNA ligase-like domain-containing protein [Favolaschia claudopus]|uniref:AKAP7 2'5' RNA ligase-like domain-containing protein n=1 Tax=Favolaschia claudopus TaxID=2862362 RepID=A0AAW0A0M8_9AGAR
MVSLPLPFRFATSLQARTSFLERHSSALMATIPPKTEVSATTSSSRGRPRRPKAPRATKSDIPRPTHFLSFPLVYIPPLLPRGIRNSMQVQSSQGHHPTLRSRIRDFHSKILSSSPDGDAPVIEGIDQSILVDPRRLHLTIGVMALSSTSTESSPAPSSLISDDSNSNSRVRTVSDAIALLQTLAPDINAISDEALRLPLDKMGVLKTQRQQAGVLYVGPSDTVTEEKDKVLRVFDLVAQRFRQEGFILEPSRPAVLHCTLINASHRKPRRIPRAFSYHEIFQQALSERPSSSDPNSSHQLSVQDNLKSIPVDFGTWAISEIQLCKMGSHGPENEYVSVASIPIGSK